ncbi:MAG TPA: serine/threonine-protein kinase, partial [Bacteroidales bacterium]|nr:serine/threonine-protein kinase [Bacteroidales bacterium]
MAGSFKNPLSPGEKLQHGKYIVIEVLGQGFFSITYLVTQLFLNKRMILHEFFLRDHFSRTDNGEVESTLLDETIYSGFRDRWFEEAKMVAKCSQNEHIAPVLDTFEENRTLYFVTEYMNEENLHSYTLEKEEKKLTEEEALELLTQIADGISFLHAQSVFHLALNPRNILIGKNKKITIVNFGIDFQDIPAEVVPDTSLLTRPGYSPPEFYRSPSRPGVFSDIYSLGAILYFLLTGKDPLPANERASGSDAGQKWMLPGISDKMSRTIRKAMSLKPEERYPDVGDFIRDLQEKRPVHRATTGMKPVYLAAAVVAGILLGSAAL